MLLIYKSYYKMQYNTSNWQDWIIKLTISFTYKTVPIFIINLYCMIGYYKLFKLYDILDFVVDIYFQNRMLNKII